MPQSDAAPARSVTGQDLRMLFGAASTDWLKEVGNAVEVKGDWWVGGSADSRRTWEG